MARPPATANVFAMLLPSNRGERRSHEEKRLQSFIALIAGSLIGAYTGRVMRNRAFGTVADILLGITGAFAVCWILDLIGVEHDSWNYGTILVVCGAALSTATAHFVSSWLQRLPKQGSWR